MKRGDAITNSDEKTRAVYLTALMLLSLGAGTVAFAGGGTAQASGNISYEFQGSFVYQGQDIVVTGGDIDSSNNYDLRQVDSFNDGTVDASSFAEQLRVFNTDDDTDEIPAFSELEAGDNTDFLVIETDDLDAGNFFIRGGDLSTNPDADDTFEVGLQEINAGFSGVSDAGAEVNIDSNRGQYSLNVSANGDLTSEELFSIFAPEADLQTAVDNRVDTGVDDSTAGFGPFNAAIYTTENSGSDTKIVLINIQDPENDVDFTDIPSGDYEFNFDATDTEAQASDTVTVFEDVDQSDLTYTFEIPNDGEMYSLGIPGETEGTLADIVDPTAEGYTVFRFVDGEWTPVTDFESTTLNALDAIAIATEGASGQPDTFSLEVELATQSATTVPPQASLTEGWNFVAAPQRGDADTVLAVQHSFLVLDRFNQPSSEYLRGVGKFNTHYIGSDSQTVSPFKGYYVYAEDDTTLPGVLTGVETRTDVDEQLNLDTFSNPQNTQDELAEAQARINELEDQNAELKNEVSGLEGDVAALESENADLESEIDDLEAELQQCRAEGS